MHWLKRTFPILALTILAGVLTPARTPLRADTVYLLNGASIDGMVVGKNEGVVILQIGNLGRIEIPQKEIENIEKNNRTGYVDPSRGRKKEKIPEKEKDESGKSEAGTVPQKPGEKTEAQKKEPPKLDPDQEKQVKEWVTELTRERTNNRVRAERRLKAVGPAVIPYLLPIAKHPFDLTRAAVFRIFKSVGPDEQVVPACLDALNDDNQFVRKLAWENLMDVSGKRYAFPWQDDAGPHARQRAIERWRKWWSDEQEKHRLEQEKQKAGVGENPKPAKG